MTAMLLLGPVHEIQRWKYGRLPRIFGAALSLGVGTEKQLESVLQAARDHPEHVLLGGARAPWHIAMWARHPLLSGAVGSKRRKHHPKKLRGRQYVAQAWAQSRPCFNVGVHGGGFHPDQRREESQWPRLAWVSAAPGAPGVAWGFTDHAPSG